ncbi:MAG: UvrD-helicase domain-containing protein [bacterium]|nr:UvrD-helicase domain-containing protein [bacterium]
MDDWKALDEAQREAVTYGDGPLLIFAGAGSGKTRVLTMRIAHLISARGVSPRRILAVTFTNKAANEMRERLEQLVGSAQVRQMWVGTFHAICARILRESGQPLGIPPDFVVFDEDDQLSVVREVLKALDIDEKRFAPRSILTFISRAKEKLTPPHLYVPTDYFTQIVGRVYPRYQQRLEACHALDFDDLLMRTVELFDQHPDVLERYQRRFLHVLVDEFQDVNRAQYRIVQHLSGLHRNLCVVGDDDQSIYSWRGADVQIILSFQRDFPDAHVVKLEQNYRSTQPILDAAFHVVSKNVHRAPKRLWSQRREGLPVTVTEVAHEREEALVIAQHIALCVQQGGRRYGDFVVLYRTNAQSRLFEEVFLNYRIPYQIVGGVRFYQRKEIKDVLAYLRVIHSPNDDVSLLRIINVPPRGIGLQTVETIRQLALREGISLWAAVEHPQLSSLLTARAYSAVAQFRDLIRELRDLRERSSVTELLQEVLKRTDYLQRLGDLRDPEVQSRVENVRELLTATQQFDASPDGERGLAGFLESVALVADVDSLEEGSDRVTLMTVHAAKGLEFPIVFLVGMEEGLFPHIRSIQEDPNVEEERRLCYVALTRAKERVHITHARLRSVFGSTSGMLESRFLYDIPESLKIYWSPTELAHPLPSAKPARAAPPPADEYRVGQRVRHRTFGDGVIMKCERQSDDHVLTVVFPQAGIKQLLASIAKLEKLS